MTNGLGLASRSFIRLSFKLEQERDNQAAYKRGACILAATIDVSYDWSIMDEEVDSSGREMTASTPVIDKL